MRLAIERYQSELIVLPFKIISMTTCYRSLSAINAFCWWDKLIFLLVSDIGYRASAALLCRRPFTAVVISLHLLEIFAALIFRYKKALDDSVFCSLLDDKLRATSKINNVVCVHSKCGQACMESD